MPYADPEARKEWSKMYYQINKQMIREFYLYHNPNREHLLKYCRIKTKEWRQNRINQNPNYYKDRYQRDLELHPNLCKEQYKRKLELHPNYSKENYQKNKEYQRRNKKEYYYKNRQRIREYKRLLYLRKKIFKTIS